MTDKTLQRQAALAARRGMTQMQRRFCSMAICEKLETIPAIERAGVILSYWADGAEADLAPFHSWAVKAGKTLAFPVVTAPGEMEAYAPAGAEAMEPGHFGIPEPVPARSRHIKPEEIDVVLVPCVAFDREGGRLGRGGGYYDRYLPRCTRALRLAAAFDAQKLLRVAREGHDALVDMAVTEKDIFRCYEERRR